MCRLASTTRTKTIPSSTSTTTTAITTARERRRGFYDALAAAGLPNADTVSVDDLASSEAAYTAARRLLERPEPPTALYTSQNLITIGALRALYDLDLQHKVALVGFDDLEFADLLSPGLTVVAQDPAGIGRTAARLLFARLEGDTGPARRVELPAALVVRGSGELPPPGR